MGSRPAPPVALPLPTRPGALLAAALLVGGWLLGACTATTGYRAVGYEALERRSVLVIDAYPTPNLPPGMHATFEERFEQALLDSPHIGRIVRREQAHQLAERDAGLRASYRALSDVWSLMGVTERDMSSTLGRGADVELVAMAQLFYEPCPPCVTGGMVGVTTSVVDAGSGTLLLRLHYSRRGNPDGPEEVRAIVDDLTEQMLLSLTSAFAPKWHKLRFRNLRNPQAS